MTTTVFDASGDNEMQFECGACGRRGVVYYQTRRPEYCNDACKQRAYRRRKRNAATCEVVTKQKGRDKGRIEANLDMGLHLLICSCGRGIWTVQGNAQIGGLHCNLCNSEFTNGRATT